MSKLCLVDSTSSTDRCCSATKASASKEPLEEALGGACSPNAASILTSIVAKSNGCIGFFALGDKLPIGKLLIVVLVLVRECCVDCKEGEKEERLLRLSEDLCRDRPAKLMLRLAVVLSGSER